MRQGQEFKKELQAAIAHSLDMNALRLDSGKITSASRLWFPYLLSVSASQLNNRLDQIQKEIKSNDYDIDEETKILLEKISIAHSLQRSWIKLTEPQELPQINIGPSERIENEDDIVPVYNEETGRYLNYKEEDVFSTFLEKIYGAFFRGLFGSPTDLSQEALNEAFVEPTIEYVSRRKNTEDTSLTFLGHSTVLFQSPNVGNILFDPAGDSWVRPCFRRYTTAPIKNNDLPPVDYVFLSHNHADHGEPNMLKLLAKQHNPYVFAGKGSTDWLVTLGFDKEKIIEFDWWQSNELTINNKKIKITAVPAQHGSQTSPSDANKMLWCGFVLEVDGKKIYFAGDTANTKLRDKHDQPQDLFVQIQKRFGDIDLALLPIGPVNEPERHICGADVLDALAKLGKNTQLIPIHHGALRPGPDKMELPIQMLMQAAENSEIKSKILPLKIGAALNLADIFNNPESLEKHFIPSSIWSSPLATPSVNTTTDQEALMPSR